MGSECCRYDQFILEVYQLYIDDNTFQCKLRRFVKGLVGHSYKVAHEDMVVKLSDDRQLSFIDDAKF